jgi:hypothetical protein
LTLALHLAVAGRYDFFRDELYFIACGRHPAFGYVDQPPLVPLISAASQLFGEHLWLIRIFPALAAAGAVAVAVAFARLLGGGWFAQLLAGLSVALAPMALGLTTTFNTSAFEPFAYSLVAYLFARSAVLDDRRALLWMGAVVGITLEMKYAIGLYVVALAIGTALTPERRIFRYRELLLGTAVGVLIAAPSLIWQALHGFPFAELLSAAPDKNEQTGPIVFWLKQLLGWNPFFAPLWVCGLYASLAVRRFRPLRALGIAFALFALLMLLTPSKDYYLAGLFPPMLAIGATLRPKIPALPVLRWVYLVAGLQYAAIAFPMVYPLLEPPALVSYMQRLHLAPQTSEKGQAGEVLPQHFADQLGWRELETSVAQVYNALPEADRRRAAIITSNYGEAAALDFYGAKDGLPPALSGHNAYYRWGTHGFDGSVILRVNGNLDRYRKLCREASIAGRFGLSPFVMPYEHDRPIILCRDLRKPLPESWPDFKHYD